MFCARSTSLSRGSKKAPPFALKGQGGPGRATSITLVPVWERARGSGGKQVKQSDILWDAQEHDPSRASWEKHCPDMSWDFSNSIILTFLGAMGGGRGQDEQPCCAAEGEARGIALTLQLHTSFMIAQSYVFLSFTV